MLRARAAYTPHLGLYCIYYAVLYLLCSAYLGLYCIYVVLRFEPRARGLGRCSATAPRLQLQVFPERSDHTPFLGIFI